MKQTAVEWLIDKVEDHFCLLPVDLIDKAKQMEKEQIIIARQDGLDNGFSNGSWDSNLYYNETYGDDT